VEDFLDSYNEFIELNQELRTAVLDPVSSASDYDGAEAAFARGGNPEQLHQAIKMRNEWAEIQVELNRLVPLMNEIVEGMSHEVLGTLFGKQITTMREMSDAFQRGLTYKDQLINTRFDSPPIDPGQLTAADVPDAEILSVPQGDITELKQSQDVAMGVAANETGKLGEQAEERTEIIRSAVEDAS
jgi:hypothetical protein